MNELTPKEKELLLELLSLDMDRIGFDDDEQEILQSAKIKIENS